jgi:cobalamin biosynthesis Mg chelatase CobN
MSNIQLFAKIFCFWLVLLAAASAFSPRSFARPTRWQIESSTPSLASSLSRRQSSFLFQSSSDDADKSGGASTSKRRKKRVKRKNEQSEDSSESKSSQTQSSTSSEVKPREDDSVNMQVTDVRDLVGGRSSSAASSSSSPKATSTSDASPTAASSASSSSSSQTASSNDSSEQDSLERILQDAREMQALETKEAGSSYDEEGGELSVQESFRKILSTVVTVDFFVVCGFLLWFLLGIFCSYILKDDAVQIAFNRKFLLPVIGQFWI